MTKTHLLAVCGIVGAAALALSFLTEKPGTPEEKLEQVNLNWKPASDTSFVLPERPRTFPSILVKKGTDDTISAPLRLHSLDMDVKVVGNIATTTMTLTWYNDVNRDLEGQLIFPLGEGQSVSYYALEIDGVMKEASVVEKAEGRKVFETIIRRRIDPGLLEWTQGNNFRARIFPIPAHGYKTIKIAFDQELIATGNSFIYIQHMLFRDVLEKFRMRCQVQNSGEAPKLFGDERQTLEFKSWESAWVAELEQRNFVAGKDIAFEVPLPPGLQMAFAEPIAGDSSWFWLALTPPVSEKDKALPASIALFWDVSGSSDSSDRKKEKEVLDAYFKKVGDFTLDLVLFSNEIIFEGKYRVFEGKWDAALKKLNETPCDGGTQLGCIDPGKYSAEECILVSDALSNFGKKEFTPGHVPMFTITSNRSADHAFLKYIALATNGQFINLFTKTREEALYDLIHQPYRFISAEFDKTEIASTYPSLPASFSRTFTLSGILKKPEAVITMNFGHGSTIEHTRKVTIKKSPSVNSGLLGRRWAQKKINELDIRYEINKEEITRLGKSFSIVTRNTSLIVLDRFEDYLTYKIRPKDPEMAAQYDQQITSYRNNSDSLKKQHLESVVAQFNSRKEWFGRKFEYEIPKHKTPGLIIDSTSVTDSFLQFRGNVFRDQTEIDPQNYTEQETGPGFVFSSPPPPPPPDGITYNITAGNVTINGAAGTTYSWDFGDGRGDNMGIAGSLNYNVQIGSYNMSATDANGCMDHELNPDYQYSNSNVRVKEWDPETEYLKELKKVSKEKLYPKYILLKKKYGQTPAFFLDMANYFFKRGEKKHAVRILSNLAEMQFEDAGLLRVLAYKLKQQKEFTLAAETFKDVLKIREEEPQSYRDLGLCYAEMGRYQEATDYLCKVINRNWDGRFPGVELIAAGEVNALISRSPQPLNLDSLDKRLISHMPLDVRIVITWDTDACDVDLWVTDPTGNRCAYNNKETPIGGQISNDFTGGYGPEEFILKKAIPGPYSVEVNYYGNSQTTLAGAVTIQADMYTNYGKKGQKKETITLRLDQQKDVYQVGELVFAGTN